MTTKLKFQGFHSPSVSICGGSRLKSGDQVDRDSALDRDSQGAFVGGDNRDHTGEGFMARLASVLVFHWPEALPTCKKPEKQCSRVQGRKGPGFGEQEAPFGGSPEQSA